MWRALYIGFRKYSNHITCCAVNVILTIITHNDGENDGVNTKVFRPFIQYLIEAPFAVITVAGFPGHVFTSLAHLS